MKKPIFIFMSFLACACLGGLIATDWISVTSKTKENATHQTPKYLYKIVSPENWQKSQEEQHIVPSSLDEDFIHLATEEQIPHVTQKFWAGKEYVILQLDTEKLAGRLVYETNPGGMTQYYHLYDGTIPLDAVLDASISQKTVLNTHD